MSLYNLVHGVNPTAFFFLPMLSKHPDEYPRFRDCFLSDKERPEFDNHIHVYTRTGGGNREEYESENNKMRSMDEYVSDFDDSYDSTYASWVFCVPDRWKKDFEFLIRGDLKSVSKEYRDRMKAVYPKLKDKFDEIFEEND